MHLADWQVDKGLGVDNLHRVFANKFKLHDHHIIFDVLQVDIISTGWLLSRSDAPLQKVLNLLLALTLHQELVPVVGLLVDLIVIHSAPYLHKLGNGTLLEDLLPPLLLHCLLGGLFLWDDARVEILGQ